MPPVPETDGGRCTSEGGWAWGAQAFAQILLWVFLEGISIRIGEMSKARGPPHVGGRPVTT